MAKLSIKNKFGVAPNSLLNDDNISLKAKGLYVYMQSKPDGWNFTVEGMAAQNKEGVRALRVALLELERAFFLKRVRKTNSKGHAEYDYTLYDNPTCQNESLDNPTCQNPTCRNPTLQNPTLHFSTLSNKDNSKKELSKKEVVVVADENFSEVDLHRQVDPLTSAKIYFKSPNFQKAIELLCMDLQVEANTVNELKHMAVTFSAHCTLTGKVNRSTNEWGTHFAFWLKDPKRIKKTTDASTETPEQRRKRLFKEQQERK